MKRTFQLFWSKSWDNLIHLVLFNFIWFTPLVALFFAMMLVTMVFGGNERTSVPPAVEAAAAAEAPEAEDTYTEEAPGEAPAGEEAPAGTAAKISALMFLACAWLVFCVATGFVFYGMADIVTHYDFSGYKEVAREFSRRGPILKSIGLVTICAVTLLATAVNILFYLDLAGSKGILFLLLAGIMLWFLLFAVMTFGQTLPLVAQRRMGLLAALRSAAILSLSAPMRNLAVLAVVATILMLAVLSGAGVGFFVLAAPAVLFNCEVRARFEELEAEVESAAGEDQQDA